MTDASLLLGYLNPDTFAGGISLDVEAAEEAITRIAERIGLEHDRNGRRHSPHRQRADERRDSPRHGAARLRSATVLAAAARRRRPRARLRDRARSRDRQRARAGDAWRAVGVRAARCRRRARSDGDVRMPGRSPSTLPAFERTFERLIELGQQKMRRDGVAAEQVEIRRQADMRYAGQSYELTIDIPPAAEIRSLPRSRRFTAGTRTLWPQQPAAPGRVRQLAHDPRPPIRTPRNADRRDSVPAGARGPPDIAAPISGARRFRRRRPVYDRERLAAGDVIQGPAIVEQADTTLVIYPRQRAHLRAGPQHADRGGACA